MKPTYTLSGDAELMRKMRELSQVRFDAVIEKQLTQIYNRGKAPGGTPKRTGELRISLTKDGNVVGYTKEYAPHVEFGHRTTSGGYVQGQFYFKKNIDTQREIFNEDMKKQLAKLTKGR